MSIKSGYYEESKNGAKAVLDRMVSILGHPMGPYTEVLDVNPNTIKTWLRRGEVALKYIQGFAKEHNVSVDFILHGKEVSPSLGRVHLETKSSKVEAPNGFILVPHYQVDASAGNGTLVHSEQIVDYLAFKADWVRNTLGVAQKDLALISVKGDSMEPVLSNEDLILVDMRRSHVEDNAIYVLRLNGSLLVKRIQHKLDGSLYVMSDNPRYETEVVSADRSGDLNVLGRVVWSGRRM